MVLYNLIGHQTDQCCSPISSKTVCKYFTASIKIFHQDFDWNKCKYRQWTKFFWRLSKCKLHRVASEVYMNPFGVHWLCTQTNVVYTFIKIRKMKFIPLINTVLVLLSACDVLLYLVNFLIFLEQVHHIFFRWTQLPEISLHICHSLISFPRLKFL